MKNSMRKYICNNYWILLFLAKSKKLANSKINIWQKIILWTMVFEILPGHSIMIDEDLYVKQNKNLFVVLFFYFLCG